MEDNYKNRFDHLLEIVFSLLRWFFLILSTSLFLYHFVSFEEDYNRLKIFLVLLVFGVLYMGLAEYAIHRTSPKSRFYLIFTRFGPVFDFIAFFWLVMLTGGSESPLFPISFLIILHIAVYWGMKGGVISSLLFSMSYTLELVIEKYHFMGINLVHYIVHIIFLLVFGFLGGIIVNQERKHFYEKKVFQELSKKDFITDLYNHRTFQEELRKTIDKGKDFSLVMSDIDHFKKVNDKYGHVHGDIVLKRIGEILNTIPAKTGQAFRYGGEEFTILIYSEELDEASSFLEELKDLVNQSTFYTDTDSFRITMSYGLVQYKGETPLELIKKADQLMYQAKDNGRNCIVSS